MMSQQQLHEVDLRWKEIMFDEIKFGVRVVVMFVDPAQLHTMMASSMGVGAPTEDDLTS